MIAHSVAKPTLVVNTRVEYIKSRAATSGNTAMREWEELGQSCEVVAVHTNCREVLKKRGENPACDVREK